MDTPETRYAKTPDGLYVAYQVIGEGERDIVLFPYIFSVDGMWEDAVFVGILRRLGRLGRLIMLDLRGGGASDPIPLGALPTIEAWADDARVVLDAVGSSTAVVIGNGNFGGHIGLFLAASHPNRCEALVLHNCAARAVTGEDYPMGLPPKQLERVLMATELGWGKGPLVDVHVPSRSADEAFRRWHARFERLCSGPSVARATAEWGLRLDLRPTLQNIRVPTLVMHSEGNKLLRPDLGRFLADQITGAKFVSLPGGDQTVYGEGAHEVLDHLEEFVTGVRPVREVEDRVLATVLFTDIVNSTPMVSALGDSKWKELLDEHDALVARELDRHRGRKVTATGDGLLATFDGPARAVRCAQAIVGTLSHIGLEVRAGLHAGEVQHRGNDIAGIAVHIGQRVSAMAGPKEVLVSRAVTDLVAGSGLEFEVRGEHELKGVPGKWAIYAVKPEV